MSFRITLSLLVLAEILSDAAGVRCGASTIDTDSNRAADAIAANLEHQLPVAASSQMSRW